jgi:hypothetical protein
MPTHATKEILLTQLQTSATFTPQTKNHKQNHTMKTLDTRELVERKEELEKFRDALQEAEEALQTFDEEHANVKLDEEEEGEREDLETAVDSAKDDFGDSEEDELKEIEDIENTVSDFNHGETLIPEDDFEDYARELAEDLCGREVRDANWPFSCIDWEQAAEELKVDYISITYQGTDYLVRA